MYYSFMLYNLLKFVTIDTNEVYEVSFNRTNNEGVINGRLFDR